MQGSHPTVKAILLVVIASSCTVVTRFISPFYSSSFNDDSGFPAPCYIAEQYESNANGFMHWEERVRVDWLLFGLNTAFFLFLLFICFYHSRRFQTWFSHSGRQGFSASIPVIYYLTMETGLGLLINPPRYPGVNFYEWSVNHPAIINAFGTASKLIPAFTLILLLVVVLSDGTKFRAKAKMLFATLIIFQVVVFISVWYWVISRGLFGPLAPALGLTEKAFSMS